MANETKSTKQENVTEFTVRIDESRRVHVDVKSFFPPHANMLNRACRIATRDVKAIEKQKVFGGYYQKQYEAQKAANEEAAKKEKEELDAAEKAKREAKLRAEQDLADLNVSQQKSNEDSEDSESSAENEENEENDEETNEET